MNILLDSHALLWALHNPGEIRSSTRQALENPENLVFSSAGALWEVELKAAKGKRVLPEGWLEAAGTTGFREVSITAEDTAASARLPWHRNDPFDRLFIAQALRRQWLLATRDSFSPRYPVRRLAV